MFKRELHAEILVEWHCLYWTDTSKFLLACSESNVHSRHQKQDERKDAYETLAQKRTDSCR